jgi:hypothetical protein
MKTRLIILSACLTIIAGCAKIGAPTGGPKDVDPPKLVKCDPENFSVFFNKKKIEIWFDEYIQLKDANQQLVVSPPMVKKPSLTLKAKSFVIEIKDSLFPNTTYALNFGNSVVDNNEANPFENFRYVFSTGSYIDSLSIRGNVVGAFDLKPDKDPFIIVLHENMSDTAVYKSMPVFVGRSNKDGIYRIDNMREGKFHLYAIKDANSNFKYDPVSEPIAFIDSVFSFSYGSMTVDTDTVKKVKPKLPVKKEVKGKDATKDTARVRVVVKPKPIPAIKLQQLYFFTEKDNKQYIKSTNRKDKRKIDVIFNIPLDSNFWYKGLNFDLGDKKVLFERNITYDSLTFWVLDSTLYSSDSINIAFTYLTPDSGKLITDTVKFNYLDAGESKKKKKTEVNQLKFIPSSGSMIDLNSRITIQSNKPILKIDTSFVNFFEKIDTIEYERSFTFSRDSMNSRLVFLDYKWKPETPYRFEIYPGFITDQYHCAADTIKINYTSQKEEFYGNLILKVRKVNSPMIIQMMETKIIAERYINSDTTLIFKMLKPSSYSFKAIFDSNENKKWDTGNLKNKKQPETVLFLEEPVAVRSNWDVEKTWTIKK